MASIRSKYTFISANEEHSAFVIVHRNLFNPLARLSARVFGSAGFVSIALPFRIVHIPVPYWGVFPGRKIESLQHFSLFLDAMP